jgi:hypothetical protein
MKNQWPSELHECALREHVYKREASGRNTSCSHQILNEIEWLITQTADFSRVDQRLHDLELSLADPERESQAKEQDPADGSWGRCYTEWFFKVAASYDHLEKQPNRNQKAILEPRFLDWINSPDKLMDYLTSVSVSNIPHTGVDHYREFNESLSNLMHLILRWRPKDYDRVGQRPFDLLPPLEPCMRLSPHTAQASQKAALVGIGPAALTQREVEAYQRHVRPYILNTTTTIMGHAQHGNWAGLRYNFLGVTGQQGRLTWLADHYTSRPVAELIPLFDRIFTDILKPWYGQPKLDRVRLWVEHDPQRLFPHILEAAQTEVGLSPDTYEFDCPELGRRLRNPFHVLRHEFPKRAEESLLWYTSVVHGDLNMKNVLLDERENIYIIDFSETRQGNVVSDFARLEPILLLEHTRLSNAEETAALARHLETLYATEAYAAVPPFDYAGSDPLASKAYQILCRLRWYGDTVTLFETNIRPYLLAVFQWTACTVCFQAWEPERRRLGAIMAGILCEQLLKE